MRPIARGTTYYATSATFWPEGWADFDVFGHPLEIGQAFQHEVLSSEIKAACGAAPDDLKIPLLAGLVCCSPFDIAVYDAYGQLHQRPVWEMLGEEHLNYDLAHHLKPADDMEVDFRQRYPAHHVRANCPNKLVAWHLVGGLDPIEPHELNGSEPDDGRPVLLSDWIQHDGLQCLKVKLRGNDADWDYDRLVQVGRVAEAGGVRHLTADFNCTVTDPAYVVDVLDRLARDEQAIFDRTLYIEQPFPYDLEAHQIDVREVSRRKPLLMDESAHTWEVVKLGRSLGWTGVALKTCKTLTGALLSLCWAESHKMHVMVQDLTNPMLAQIPHLLFAAHIETMMGVETNSMQFYPDASDREAIVHPGLYQRVNGEVDLTSVRGPGFGYRIEEIVRQLPEPSSTYGRTPAHPHTVPAPHIDLGRNADAR